MQHSRSKPDFIVQFLEVLDCPGVDHKNRSNIYLRAVLWKYQTIVIRQGPPVSKPECISDIVFTPIRLDCKSAIFHSYRNLHANPSEDAVLVVQVFHATSDTPKPEMDTLLGKTEIPLAYLQTEDIFTHPVIPIRTADRASCLNFSVKLRRAFLHTSPPKRKTFFLVRHGQSKWNLAQSRINIAGMLDRDHALTDLGIRQAQQLNSRWRFHFFKEGEKFSTLDAKATKDTSTGVGKSTPIKAGHSSVSSGTPPPSVADLLDLDGFDALPAVPSKQPALSADASDGFPADPFADAFGSSSTTTTTTAVKTTNSAPDVSPPVPTSVVSADIWSREDLRKHLQRLDSTIEDSADDYRPSNFDDSDVGDVSSGDELDEDNMFAPRLNFADEFVSGVPIPQTSKIELAEKFNHADIKLVDEYSGRVNQNLVEQRRQEYMKLFLHADAIYSSPLTRALQTAVLTMNGHPATKTYGITLYSIIREVKRIGGLDTVGIACGEAIETRLRAELAMILGAEEADRLVTFPIDFHDANQPWWTPMADHETEQQQQDRVREFLTFLRHCDAQIPVFVGHSLFFRAFYSKRVSSNLLKNRRKLSENLKKFLLSNATMLAVTVNFTEYSMGGGLSEAIMIDADIIFGGGFHGAENEDGSHGDSHHSHGKGVSGGAARASAHKSSSTKDSLSGFIAGISHKAVGTISGTNNSTNKSSTSQSTSTGQAATSGAHGGSGSFTNSNGELFGFISQDTQKQWQKELESGRQAATNTMKKWSSAVKDFLDT